MSDETGKEGVRFVIDDHDPNAAQFIYRPPGSQSAPISPPLGVKFAQCRMVLDDYWVVGRTKWSRFVYRMHHFPLVAIGRFFKQIARRLRWWKEKRVIMYHANKRRREKLNNEGKK
jgi:hypothetical protein